MLRHKAYKFRIYSTIKQEVIIVKTIGASRYIYNQMLNEWNTTYKKTGKGLSYIKCSAMLPEMKRQEETKWLKEVDSIALLMIVFLIRIVYLFVYKIIKIKE